MITLLLLAPELDDWMKFNGDEGLPAEKYPPALALQLAVNPRVRDL